MPRNRDLDDFDDEDDEDDYRQQEDSDNSPLVRRLRKELKSREKQLNEFDSRLKEYEKRDRVEVVGSALKAAEVNEQYARWVVRDLEGQDITKETVEKWLTDNAGLVGFKPVEAPSSVNEDTQNSLRRIQSAEKGATSSAEADPIAAKLSDPNLTPAELEQILGKSLTA